jgi:hypothetical protein
LLLSDNSHQALIAVTASLMGLQVSAVSIVSEYLIDTNSTSSLSQVGVVFRFLVQKSDFPALTFDTPASMFSVVSEIFDSSVSGGQFDTALISMATQYQAAELFESGFDPTVTVAPPTYTTVDTAATTEEEDDHYLGGGAIAGIVIGVVVVFALIVMTAWYAFKDGGQSAPAAAVVTALDEQEKNILVNNKGGEDVEKWEVVNTQQLTVTELGCSSQV